MERGDDTEVESFNKFKYFKEQFRKKFKIKSIATKSFVKRLVQRFKNKTLKVKY